MSYAKNIIQRGISELVSRNDELFKQNLMYALSFKLNESIETTKIETQNKIFKSVPVSTNITEDVAIFLNFLNSYKIQPTDKILLKNNDVININESEIKSIQMLFEQLSPQNREKMAETIFNDTETFKQHLNFYKETQELI
jgi:hypothetical protein